MQMAFSACHEEGRRSVIRLNIHVRILLEKKLDDIKVAFLARTKKRGKAVIAMLRVDVHSEAKARLDSLHIATMTSTNKIFNLLLGELPLWLLLLLLLLGLALCLLANRPVGLPVLHLALTSAVLGLHAPAACASLARVDQGRLATCAFVDLHLAL